MFAIVAFLLLGATNAAAAELRLSPSVCALPQSQSHCREMIDIQWRSEAPLSLCLFVDQQSQPLECWRSERSGQLRYRTDTEQTLKFYLRSRSGNNLIASERLEVIREHTEYRSRRRKPWNFF